MINRWVEDDGLLTTLEKLGVGSIVFSPLARPNMDIGGITPARKLKMAA